MCMCAQPLLKHCRMPCPCLQVWAYQGSNTLAHYLKQRDCLQALARDLRVGEDAVVPTVMQHILRCLEVGVLCFRELWRRCIGCARVIACMGGFGGLANSGTGASRRGSRGVTACILVALKKLEAAVESIGSTPVQHGPVLLARVRS